MPDTSNTDVSLRVSNVTKRFGEFTAVDDLSFDVRAGRVFGFLGPNGAGKTTTIRMIVGITIPDSGTVELFGERVSPALQNRIGYLPEERGLYKKMKVVDQLKYFAALKGVTGGEAEKRIDFWLERMRLSASGWADEKRPRIGARLLKPAKSESLSPPVSCSTTTITPNAPRTVTA